MQRVNTYTRQATSRASWTSLCHTTIPLIAGLALLVSGCETLRGPQSTTSAPWNFVQVDVGFYRGGQPSPDELRWLAGQGFRTIVDLRQHFRTPVPEQAFAEELGMAWVNIPVWAWWFPSIEHTRQLWTLVTDPASQPVYVHCRFGRNRTGVISAMYRVLHQGWSPEEAFRENRRLGLVPWNFVTRWVIFHKIPRFLEDTNPASDLPPTDQTAAAPRQGRDL